MKAEDKPELHPLFQQVMRRLEPRVAAIKLETTLRAGSDGYVLERRYIQTITLRADRPGGTE